MSDDFKPIDFARIRAEKAGERQAQETQETLRGPAECGWCRYKWEAVVEVGITHFECPQCKRGWGLFVGAVEPSPPDQVWTCRCGEALFWILPHEIMCRKCGQRQTAGCL